MKLFCLVVCLLLVGCSDITGPSEASLLRSRVIQLEEQVRGYRLQDEVRMQEINSLRMRCLPSPFEPACNNDWVKWDEIKKAAEKACKKPARKVGSVKLLGKDYEVVE